MADNVSIQGLQFEISTKTSDSQMTKGINNYANALKNIGNASQNATSGLQALNTALGKVKNVKNLDKFAQSLAKLGEVRISSSIAKNITAIGDAVSQMTDENLGKLQKFSDALANLKGVNLGSISASQSSNASSVPTTNVGNLSNVTGENASGLGSLANAADSARSSASRFASVFQGIKTVASSVGGTIASVAGSFRNLAVATGSKLAAGMKTFTSALGKIRSLGGFIKSVPGKIAGLIPGVSSLTSAFGNLFSSIKRIALYRAIRFFFAQLTRAMKEGISNLYQYSAVMGGTFKQSMDSLATSFLYLKNSMGAMVSPLINALAPAVEYIIDKFVALINIVNQFFAALTGKKTTTVAKRVATTFKAASDSAGDTAGGVSKAAKELKRSILGFDEINALNAPDKSSGGSGGGSGGGGASSPDYSDMFETIDVDSGISDWVQDLKDAFNAGDWQELGTLLGTKFNEIVESIKWEDLGKKIGEGINGIIQTAYWTLDTIDFKRLGYHFAELVNGAFSEIDFNIAGALSVKKFTVIIDTIIGFLGGLDWGLIGESVSDYLTGAFDEVTKWIRSYNWSEVGTGIWTGIKEFFTGNEEHSGFNASEVASAIAKVLGSAIKMSVDLISGFTDGMADDIANALSSSFESAFKNNPGDLRKAILEWLGKGIVNIGSWVVENIIEPFIQGLTNNDNWKFPDISGWFADKFKAALGFVGDIGKWIKDHLFPSGVSIDMGDLKLSLADTTVGVTLTGVISSTFNTMKTAWESVTSSTVVKTITAAVGSGWNTVKNAWENIKNGTATKTIMGVVGRGWGSINTAWKGLKSKAINLRAKVTGTASGIIGKIQEKWKWLKNNGVITFRAKVMDSVYTGFKKVWNSFASAVNGIADKANPYLSIVHISIPKLGYLAKGGITTGATPAIVGEAGKEAVLPLERNLGWQRGLAEQLVAKMGDANPQSDNAGMLYSETVRQNELLTQQNRILNLILEKDPEIKVTAASIQDGLSRKNLRDGKTTVPVY